MTATVTDWIKPGAPVVVVYRYSSNPPVVTNSTITRVTKTQFAVEGVDRRFRLDNQQTAYQGGSGFGHSYYQAYDPSSDTAKELVAQHNRRVRLERADSVVRRWLRDRTRENRLAAIVALEAVEAVED